MHGYDFEFTKTTPEQFFIIRRQLIDRFGLKESDKQYFLDVANQLGLKMPECIVVDRESIDEFKKIDVAGFHNRFLQDTLDSYGTYIPELDLVILLDSEKYSSPEEAVFRDAWIIYEVAHSNSGFTDIINFKEHGYQTPRVGFQVFGGVIDRRLQSGIFLEEAWADFQRGRFMNIQFEKGNPVRKLLEELLDYGSLSKNEVLPFPFKNRALPIPLKYIVIENGNLNVKGSSLAAFAIELLIGKFPHIKILMSKARYNVEDLKMFIRALNNIDPALYPFLQKLKYTFDDFDEGLAWVIDHKVGGIQNVLVGNTNQKLIETWSKLTLC